MKPSENAVMFGSILDKVRSKSPFQRKRLDDFLAARDETYWARAERFAARLIRYLEAEGLDVDGLVDSYLGLCSMMMKEQREFMKTGRYRCASYATALEEVYRNEGLMRSYMHGLLLSYFLWRNHYLMLDFYLDGLSDAPPPRTGLEIGAGHGLYISEALDATPGFKGAVVDVSPVSIEMTRKLVQHWSDRHEELEFIVGDARELTGRSCDFVVMGEVLEHVENPETLLDALRGAVSADGRAFVTTCANCPAVDHVHLFESVGAIRSMLGKAGFRIERDIALPVEDLPEERWEAEKMGVNYAAFLRPERTAQ